MLRWRVDVHDPARADAVVEAMATPWFPVNEAANRGLQDDLRTSWAPVARRVPGLAVPVLILEGREDIRPRWAVDPLAAALPEVTRVQLPGVGHLPWLEAPDAVLPVLRDFLEAGR
jgi:proline iminopeptidase